MEALLLGVTTRRLGPRQPFVVLMFLVFILLALRILLVSMIDVLVFSLPRDVAERAFSMAREVEVGVMMCEKKKEDILPGKKGKRLK